MAIKITYSKDQPAGTFCQLKLDSGERILISIAQTGLKIYKLSFFGFFPTKVLWELDDVKELVKIFVDVEKPFTHPLDNIIDYLNDCKNIDEAIRKLNNKKIKL